MVASCGMLFVLSSVDLHSHGHLSFFAMQIMLKHARFTRQQVLLPVTNIVGVIAPIQARWPMVMLSLLTMLNVA